MLFFRDFSCGFRVPSTCRDPQGERMCLRSAKIAATNDRCPSCPTEIFSFAFLPSSPAIKPFQPLARFFWGTGNEKVGERLCGNGEWLENDHQHLTNFFAHFVK